MAKLVQNYQYIYQKPSFKSILNGRNLVCERTIKAPSDPYIILRPTCNDSNEILDLMWTSYHPDEPCTRSLGLGQKRNCVFDEHARQILSRGYSLVAKCKHNGHIVGAALNDSTCPWDPDMLEKFACTLRNNKISQLLMFWAYLQRAPKVWDKFCQLNVFEIGYLFVHSNDRGNNLAQRLMEASRDLAIDAGFKVIRVDCTSIRSAKICEKLKMEKIFEMPFSSYVSKSNDVVFKIPPPDLSVRTYVYTSKTLPKK